MRYIGPVHTVATDNSDQIEVTYFALHVGRGTDKTTELKHQRLPKSAQNEITAMLQLGVSADRILTGTAASPSLYVFQWWEQIENVHRSSSPAFLALLNLQEHEQWNVCYRSRNKQLNI